MIVSLYWLEPEAGSWIVSVKDATDDELREIRTWARKEAGDEWGNTIPSIRLTPGDVDSPLNKIPLEDFAAAIRYSAGEEVFERDCPTLKRRGIERS